MSELIQKKLFQSKHYKILDGEVYISIKSQSEHNEWCCSLEELGLKKLYKKQPKTIKTIAAGTFLFIAIATVFAFFFFPEPEEQGVLYVNFFGGVLLALILFLIPTKNEILLYGGSQDLEFFRNIPNEETVDKFVDELVVSFANRFTN